MSRPRDSRDVPPPATLGRDLDHAVEASVAALVLTYKRPRLATQVVRMLLQDEKIEPRSVFLVINGEGGLEDPDLERSISVLRINENLGPAGGYRRGLEHIYRRSDAHWIYIVEDDLGLFGLPTPRLAALVHDVEAFERQTRTEPVGAVVSFGRDMDTRTGITLPHNVANSTSRFENVDVAAWGASLLSRRVLAGGVWPDERWFFGYEDFDFWLRVRRSGFRLLVDTDTARALAGKVTQRGRDESFTGERPKDAEEPWRSYYTARNFLELRRRYGNIGWTVSHSLKSLRRMQLAGSRSERLAIIRGVVDGFRGELGKSPIFQRATGER